MGLSEACVPPACPCTGPKVPGMTDFSCCFSGASDTRGLIRFCYTLEQYQNLKEGDIRGVGGKGREGNKRQDDNWGGLGTTDTKFISFPVKAEAQLRLGAWKRSKMCASLCWARPPLGQLAVCVGPAAVPSFPQTWGTENPIS